MKYLYRSLFLLVITVIFTGCQGNDLLGVWVRDKQFENVNENANPKVIEFKEDEYIYNGKHISCEYEIEDGKVIVTNSINLSREYIFIDDELVKVKDLNSDMEIIYHRVK
ncbi:MAG: hypothetical protein U9Q33_07025 [Campylobacterota bacterium]|nr:hypothetical protein [Campylobacterota bacterium]